MGLPNVGKSTLFNALTRNNVVAANYPFATIEPNEGVVSLPDPRLDKLAELFDSERVVPAPVTFVDIAGLVKGASEGAGLGNKFLAHIRECDAICQVVRVFSDDDVTHVAGEFLSCLAPKAARNHNFDRAISRRDFCRDRFVRTQHAEQGPTLLVELKWRQRAPAMTQHRAAKIKIVGCFDCDIHGNVRRSYPKSLYASSAVKMRLDQCRVRALNSRHLPR